MLTQENYDRYIHYKNHIYNTHINYIRLNNCKYCKQDKRDYFGSKYRRPLNFSRHFNRSMNLLNYNRVQNIINNSNSNPIRNLVNNTRYIPSNTTIRTIEINNHRRTIIPRNITLNQRESLTVTIDNSANVNSANVNSANVNSANVNSANVNSANVNSANVNSANVNNTRINLLDNNVNFIQRNIQNVGRITRYNPTINRYRTNILRNNYVNPQSQYNIINNSFDSLSDDEIIDFEELTDMEVKTTLEEVNKGTEIELYDSIKRDYCTICCDEIKYTDLVRKMKCGHIFHYKCLDEWLENNRKCPVCRFSL